MNDQEALTTDDDQTTTGGFRSAVRRWKRPLFVAVLIELNLLNYMDRYTVAGTLTDIQRTFGIGDSDAGLIVTVFVCCYMMTAPLFGFCGDRYNRKLLIIIGLLVWSSAVLLSSMCENFLAFLALRALVGVGEAAYATVAPTIISDLFSGVGRSQCLMFFYSALPIGSGLGYIVGASVDYETGSWRWGMRVTPLIGFFLLIAIVFFEDPERGRLDHAQMPRTSYREDLLSLWKIRTFVLVTLAFTSVTFVTGSMAWWTPTIAQYAWSHLNGDVEVPAVIKKSISVTFGMLTCAAGLGGVVLGAMVARWFHYGTGSLPPPFDSRSITPRGPRADAEVCCFGTLFAVPAMWLALFTVAKSMPVGWAFVFLAIILAVSNMAVTTDIILYITPSTRRSTAIAIQTLCVHLLGDALSPYIVGLLSDFIHGSRTGVTPSARFQSLQYALFVPNSMLLLGAILYFRAAEHIEKDTDYNHLITHDMNPPSILEDDIDDFIGRITDVDENDEPNDSVP